MIIQITNNDITIATLNQILQAIDKNKTRYKILLINEGVSLLSNELMRKFLYKNFSKQDIFLYHEDHQYLTQDILKISKEILDIKIINIEELISFYTNHTIWTLNNF